MRKISIEEPLWLLDNPYVMNESIFSMDQFAIILEQASDAIFVLDLQGNLVLANPAAEQLFGDTGENIKGIPFSNYLAAGDAVRLQEEIQKAAISERRWEGEVQVRSAIREEALTVRLDLFRIDNKKTGSAEKFVAIARDLTEQKKTEEALAEALRRVDSALIAGEVATFDWDVEQDRVYGDANFGRLFSVELDQQGTAPVKAYLDAIHPDDQQKNNRLVERSVETGANYESEYRIRRKDGDRWVISRGRMIRNSSGKVTRFHGVVLDIDDRKKAEQEREKLNVALESSESRFRQLANTIPQLTWMAHPDGAIFWYNVRWYEYTGATPEQMEGWGWQSVHDPNRLPQVMEQWKRSISTGEPFDMTFPLKGADGIFRPFLTRVMPFRNEEGKVLLWFGTNTDITEQLKLMQEREELLLSERAARSTAELASSMKDEFLATLSHELRTPLNAIFGWVQLIKGTSDLPLITDGLEVIDRNVRIQVKLIEDLLDMSRIISGKLRLDISTVNPSSIIESALETLAPATLAKGITIERAIDSNAGTIAGDASRLQQVMWNLLSNAIKFTPKEGKVKVTLERVNSHLEICVTDTGEGIAAEFVPHVFDRFRQQDSSPTRHHGGLGLGLSIVKQLVELHGGMVVASSPGVGRGAKFVVQLPLMAVRDQYGPRVISATRAENPVPSTKDSTLLKDLKILVVDDEADVCRLLKHLLEDYEAQVETATSALEAMEKIKSSTPDVFISDIGMPHTDGYQLLKDVRMMLNEKGIEIPAVALTAFARSEDRTRALLAGFHAHIAKPVEPSELVATIAAVSRRNG